MTVRKRLNLIGLPASTSVREEAKVSEKDNRVRTVRLVRLANILQRGQPVSRQALEEELEVARATLTRDLAVLRDQLNMPVTYDRMADGYILAKYPSLVGPRYELPGVWLSETQAYGVLTLINLLKAVAGHILPATLDPLRGLAKQVIGLPTDPMPQVSERISIELPGAENLRVRELRNVAQAMYSRRQVTIIFGDDPRSRQRCSPQRFVLLGDGWHVDAYSETERKVFRIPFPLVRKAMMLKGLATELEWNGRHWENTKGRIIHLGKR